MTCKNKNLELVNDHIRDVLCDVHDKDVYTLFDMTKPADIHFPIAVPVFRLIQRFTHALSDNPYKLNN